MFFVVVCLMVAVVVVAGWFLVDFVELCSVEVWALPSEWFLVAAVVFAVDVGCRTAAYLLPLLADKSVDRVLCP
jgi:type VI protein secretion system component VasK